MPVTALQLTILFLFFAIAIARIGMGLLFLLIPSQRVAGRLIFFQTAYAMFGLIFYQIAYLPIVGIAAALSFVVAAFSPHLGAALANLVFLIVFFPGWLIAMVAGSVSGVFIGRLRASGMDFTHSVRKDPIVGFLISLARKTSNSHRLL